MVTVGCASRNDNLSNQTCHASVNARAPSRLCVRFQGWCASGIGLSLPSQQAHSRAIYWQRVSSAETVCLLTQLVVGIVSL